MEEEIQIPKISLKEEKTHIAIKIVDWTLLTIMIICIIIIIVKYNHTQTIEVCNGLIIK